MSDNPRSPKVRQRVLALIDGLSPKPTHRQVVVSNGAKRGSGATREAIESIVGEAVRCDRLEPPGDLVSELGPLSGIVRVNGRPMGVVVEEATIRVVAVRPPTPVAEPIATRHTRADLLRIDEATVRIQRAVGAATHDQLQRLLDEVQQLRIELLHWMGPLGPAARSRAGLPARSLAVDRLLGAIKSRRRALALESRGAETRLRDGHEVILRSACESLNQLMQKPHLKLGRIRSCWKAIGGALDELELEAGEQEDLDSLRDELSDLRMFEVTAADLAASLGAQPISIETAEQFEAGMRQAPPDPNEAKPKRKRKR